MNAAILTAVATFAAVFCALWAAHSVGDHWIQTHHQACAKGAPGWTGRIACVKHVATLTGTKAAALAALVWVTGLHLNPLTVVVGLLVDAVSHYWADRRTTLARLAKTLRKSDFHQLGDGMVAPCGTGAYALDQSWHHLWLFITALAIAAGGTG
ncbi:transcriptional regulator [Streptosporangium sp. NPDC000239]|uniref:transcriptional regulator n=1 Tax=Streptosporangium sp. NPDC000239 TaxID=3154248 RepID=UPI00333022CA